MFIEELYVKSFRGLKDLEIKFNKPKTNYYGNLNVSILVGENGTGKSSILQLLTYIFSPSQRQSLPLDMNYGIKYKLNDENIEYDISQHYPEFFPSKLIVSSYSVFDPYLPRFVPSRFKRRRKDETKGEINETEYVYCGPNDHGYSTLEPVIPSILQAIFIPKEDEEKYEIYQNLLQKIKCKQAIAFTVHKERIEKELHYAINEMGSNNNYDKVIQFYEKLRELGEANKSLNRRGRRVYSIPIELFSTELLDLYSSILELEFDSCIRDIIFENLTGDDVFLSEMSSGEITMLFRFLPLVLEIQDGALIVIDEPETHLHPSWEQEFILNISNFFGKYKAHVLLATHSPTIISDVPMECIVGLNKVKGFIQQYSPTDPTLGGDPSQLLYDVLGLQQLQGDFSTKKMEYIRNLLEGGNLTPNQLTKIRDIYNDLSTTIEKYELYEKYESFLEE